MITHGRQNIVQNSEADQNCGEKGKKVSGSIPYYEYSSEYNNYLTDLQIDSNTLNDLLSIIRDLNSELKLRKILDKILNGCIAFFQAERGAILLHNENDEFELKAARDNKHNNLLSFPISKTITDLIIEKRNSLFFPDIIENESLSSTQRLIESEHHSIMCAPLENKITTVDSSSYSTNMNELLGLIYLESNDTTGTGYFKVNNLQLLQVLADQGVVAVNNALHNEKLEKSIDELENRINVRTEELADSNRQLSLTKKNIQKLHEELEKKVKSRTKNLKNTQENLTHENQNNEFADITAETLHNVKNILNSIKVSSELAGKLQIGKAYTGFYQANEMLRKNIDQIEDFICKDSKGKKLMQYYLKLEEVFRDETKESKNHFNRLKESVDIISDIISAQQGYGKGSEMEDISLGKLIDDALTMQFSTLTNSKINVIKNYSDLPTISIQKTKFMHVLINLIKNAKEAMINTPVENRMLTFEYGQNERALQLKISDNGCGIAKKNLKHLFSYGFTTKKDGHGYGLHSCQVYMKEMGGTITVFSEGLGKGATFTIELAYSAKK